MIGMAIGAGIGAAKGLKAKHASDKEAELRWMAVQEEVRLMEETHADIIGQARADVGASGFASNSESHQATISEAETELARQRSIALMMGETQKDVSNKASKGLVGGMALSGAMSGNQLGQAAGSWFS